MEIWKDIKDYEGLYQVSNLGRIKSLYFSKEKILTTHICKGYQRIGLSKNGKQMLYYIHVLVAEAFIPNPLNLPEVNHKDENKMNNCISNLEWCTRSYNNNYGTRNKRIGKTHLNHPNQSKPVQCVETGITYLSAHEAARQTGIDYSKICAVCRGKRNKTGGYHWKFLE